MTRPTEEQWKTIDKMLCGLFGMVELQIDGFSAKYRKSMKRMRKSLRDQVCPGWDKKIITYWPVVRR